MHSYTRSLAEGGWTLHITPEEVVAAVKEMSVLRGQGSQPVPISPESEIAPGGVRASISVVTSEKRLTQEAAEISLKGLSKIWVPIEYRPKCAILVHGKRK